MMPAFRRPGRLRIAAAAVPARAGAAAALGLLSALLSMLPLPAAAQDFRSIGEPAAVLYDAPSTKAKRMWVVGRGYPLQVASVIEGWARVRDATGDTSWVETRSLSSARTVLVRATMGTLRDSPSERGAVVLRVGRDVVLDMVEAPVGDWVRVRHRDGANGFIHVNQVFGL
jgi:SH3-like domain-containing protein